MHLYKVMHSISDTGLLDKRNIFNMLALLFDKSWIYLLSSNFQTERLIIFQHDKPAIMLLPKEGKSCRNIQIALPVLLGEGALHTIDGALLGLFLYSMPLQSQR